MKPSFGVWCGVPTVKPSFRPNADNSSTYDRFSPLLTVLLGDSKGVRGSETRPCSRHAELDTPLIIC